MGIKVEDYMGLARYHANRMVERLPRCIDRDDLFQAGCLGLIGAAKRFREGNGAAFDTYATLRVRGAMKDQLRRESWRADGRQRRGGPTVEVWGLPPECATYDPPPKELSARLLAGLDRAERLLITLRYLEGFTLAQAARVLGVGEPRACQIHGKAITKLRKSIYSRKDW